MTNVSNNPSGIFIDLSCWSDDDLDSPSLETGPIQVQIQIELETNASQSDIDSIQFNCPVCLEILSVTKQIKVSCNHVTCLECYIILQKNRSNCPLCRGPM